MSQLLWRGEEDAAEVRAELSLPRFASAPTQFASDATERALHTQETGNAYPTGAHVDPVSLLFRFFRSNLASLHHAAHAVSLHCPGRQGYLLRNSCRLDDDRLGRTPGPPPSFPFSSNSASPVLPSRPDFCSESPIQLLFLRSTLRSTKTTRALDTGESLDSLRPRDTLGPPAVDCPAAPFVRPNDDEAPSEYRRYDNEFAQQHERQHRDRVPSRDRWRRRSSQGRPQGRLSPARAAATRTRARTRHAGTRARGT